MATNTKQLIGSIAAGFFGASLVLVAGAGNPSAPVSPRYSVQYTGPVLLVTDNESNKLYVYENTGGKASELRQVLDLTQTGKAELTATKTEAGR